MRSPWILAVLLLAASVSPAPGAGEDAAYLFSLAQVLSEEGEISEALKAFDRAVELAPEDPYIRLEYAELLSRVGSWDGAAKQIEEARRLAPENADATLAAGQIHVARMESDPEAADKAIAAFERLRTLDPSDPRPLWTLGQIYLRLERPADAAAVLQDLVDHHPGDRRARGQLVNALLQAGMADEAEVVLRKILGENPDSTRARIALADLQTERGDHAAAAETLEGLSDDALQDAELLRRRALELFRSGRIERALEDIGRFLERSPGDPSGRYLRGLILFTAGETSQAVDVLEGLLAELPGHLDTGLLLARALEQDGRPDQGLEVLDKLAVGLRSQGKPDEAREVDLRRIAFHARRGNWEEVADIAEDLLAKWGSETVPDLVFVHADALVELGRPSEALASLGQVPESSPLAGRVRAHRAEILFNEGQEDAASEVLQSLVETGDVQDLMFAVEVLQSRERYEEAIPLLEKALGERPESTQALFLLGAAFERTGLFEDSERVFQRLLEVDPDFAPGLNYLGYMWAEKGIRLEEAQALTDRAVSLDPDNGAYIDSLGWTHFRLGNYEEARLHLERAAALVPGDGVIYEHLGDLYSALGAIREAREAYIKALELDLESAENVEQKLQRLPGDL